MKANHMESMFPVQSIVISGDDVNDPTKSANIFVKAEIRMAGPTSAMT